MYLGDRQCKILPVVETVHQDLGIRRNKGGFLLEFSLKEADGFVNRAVEEPANHAESEHIARLENGFVVQPRVFERFFGKGGQMDGDNLHRVGNTEFEERIVGAIEGFLKVFGSKRIHIHDDHRLLAVHSIRLVVAGIGVVKLGAKGADFQCRRIHSDDNIRFVARRMYAITEIDLKTRYTAECTLRGANLCGEIGERGNLVTEDSTQRGEHRPRELHSVA